MFQFIKPVPHEVENELSIELFKQAYYRLYRPINNCGRYLAIPYSSIPGCPILYFCVAAETDVEGDSDIEYGLKQLNLDPHKPPLSVVLFVQYSSTSNPVAKYRFCYYYHYDGATKRCRDHLVDAIELARTEGVGV
jgi:hypothetical protein